MNTAEIADKGRQIYETRLRALLERGSRGKYVAIDVNSGDYEVGGEYLTLATTLRARRPDALPYIVRIGYSAVGRIGPRVRPVTP